MIDESRRQRWEKGADWPLTITALVFLAAYAGPILRPDMASPWPTICQLATWAAWAGFVVDYVGRFALSRDRVSFVRGNLFDLAVVALPLLRPLRLLRLVTLLSVLNRYAGGSLRGRVAVTSPDPRLWFSSSPHWRSSTPSAAPRMPTSPRSGMRRGGR